MKKSYVLCLKTPPAIHVTIVSSPGQRYSGSRRFGCSQRGCHGRGDASWLTGDGVIVTGWG